MTEWMTVSEAAAATGYHADHLRELIRAQKVRAVKKGNSWWVDHQSLLKYAKAAQNSGDKRRGPKN